MCFEQALKEQDVITNSNIREYFYESFNHALSHQNKSLSPETTFYIVNLLTNFSTSKEAFKQSSKESGLKPLAFIYSDAIQSETKEQKFIQYKYLGDITLFISGVFYLSLNKSLVDVDYYIGMGENAYHTLVINNSYSENSAFNIIFTEISQQFLSIVELLNEVSYEMENYKHEDILRLYEVWLKTNNQFCAEKLREFGIEPNQSLNQYSH